MREAGWLAGWLSQEIIIIWWYVCNPDGAVTCQVVCIEEVRCRSGSVLPVAQLIIPCLGAN